MLYSDINKSCAIENVKLFSTVISVNISQNSFQEIGNEVIKSALKKESRTICFANVHMTVEAAVDPKYANIVNGADWVVADGIPLVWVIRKMYRRNQEQITGLNFMNEMLKRSAEEKISVFFYGCTVDILNSVVKKCQRKYPTLDIAGTYSPPFRPLTEIEENEIVNIITNSGANMVFVALGCPRQEIWLDKMRHSIPAVMLAIGGALPMLAGHILQAPHWIQKIGLEWFYRLCQEPSRLFKRYMVTNTIFILLLICIIFLKKNKIKN